MIDIHSHILYGVDDGSKDLSMSLVMLKEEMEEGVSTVYLTPHQNKQTLTGPLLKERYQSFLDEIKDRGIDLDIRLGSEIYYYPGLKQDLLSGKALTMDESKYVLVEFSTRTETNVSEIVYELVIAGFIPIIAHIERYPYLKKQDYFDIKDAGALIQINASSFKHFSSRGIIKYLLKNDLVDYVGSDAHDPIKRKVDFSFVHSYIKKKHPSLYARLIDMKRIG